MIVTDDLPRISKFILTGFTTQSLYYPQILRITTAKIIAAITRSRVSFFFGSLCHRAVYNRENKKT